MPPRVNCNRASIDPSDLGRKPERFMPKREYKIRAIAPRNFSLRDLSHCARIVRTGDTVDPDSATVELPRSKLLALASGGNLIVGVGAIKRPRPEYARQRAVACPSTQTPQSLATSLLTLNIEVNDSLRALSMNY